MPSGLELFSVAMLVVLGFAIARPKGLPEATVAVPAAVAVILVGAIDPQVALAEMRELAPTAGFLAASLVLAHLCQEEGLFAAAGHLMAKGARGEPIRLLRLVFAAAALTTAVLGLDATVVLLTPVVFATAARSGVRAKPHVYATAHLANSASLLLPVSNLTNLLAMRASGLDFMTFAAVMAVPWLVAVLIEYVVVRRYFGRDLMVRASDAARKEDAEDVPVPRVAVSVLLMVLVGFAASSPLGIDVVWVALFGVALLGGWRLLTSARRAEVTEVRRWVLAADLPFAAFVLALGVVVAAVVDNGLAQAVQDVVPRSGGLGDLLLLAVGAAVLANMVNNLPATLILLPFVASAGPAAVLAVLIGVNIGPNLTYVGSLATLLWRRIMADHDHDAEVAEFTRLGAWTVPLGLVACTTALWGVTTSMGL